MIKIDSKIVSLMRKAINDKRMIEDGDRVVVGLSGGKDSTTLLAALAAYQRFAPEKFSLYAITIDMGFEALGFHPDLSALKQFVADLGVEYIIEPTQIMDIVFNIRKESNPCSLCSKIRRGTLNAVMNKRGFNKLALGHHADDLMETFLLSLLYEGRLNTLSAVSFMDKSEVTLIRPFIYVDEKQIAAASKNFPIVDNPCPSNHRTKREYMKELIASLQKDNPGARKNIFGSLVNPQRNNLWE